MKFDYIDYLKKNSYKFRAAPFWSWNDTLEKEELIRQIDDMKKIGFGGFFMHARSGLKTEYFSDEWFSCVNECVAYAQKQGMAAWAYDENGWPSGFADRKLLNNKDNWSSFLKSDIVNIYPNRESYESLNTKILVVYYFDNNKPILVEKNCGEGKYLVITCNKEGSYVDVLNPNINKQFLDIIYLEYKKRFGEHLGKDYMPGFFTDEPQYFRYATPWSDVLPELFMKKYAHSIYDVLPSLFVEYNGDSEDRYEYWSLLSETFIENWIKPVYEWCESNNCKLTGHAIEESALFTQMWCTGGVMPFYQYEHIPGVDHLGRNVDPGLEAKQVGSASAQLGKKRVLAEIYACAGCDATPRELKSIGDAMYVDGVNYTCHHLYPYSSRGERKYDHPPHFSDIMPWHDYLKEYNSYFDNLGCVLSLGKDVTDVLVLHPIHSAYLHYRREEDYESIKNIEDTFKAQLKELWSRHILFHLGDEIIIKNIGRVENDAFCVGECSYHTVIIPDMETIDKTTLDLLNNYQVNGGKILCLGKTPDFINGKKSKVLLKSNTTMEKVCKSNTVKIEYHGKNSDMLKWAMRDNGETSVIFIANLTDSNMDKIHVICDGELVKISSDYDKYIELSNQEFFSLKAHESLVLICDNQKEKIEKSDYLHKEESFKKLDISIKEYPENILVLDNALYSFDGIDFEEIMPTIHIRQKLLESRYKGRVWLKYCFEAENIPSKLLFVSEPQNNMVVSINNILVEPIDMWRIDRSFKTYDISANIKIGMNEVVVSFDYYQNDDIYSIYFGNGTESLRNCMSFDTEIDPAYLFGDFSVDTNSGKWKKIDNDILTYSGNFRITNNGVVNSENITESGYPFFAGKIKMSGSFDSNSTDLTIKANGRFAIIEVYVNNSFAGIMMFNNTLDISKYANIGQNTIDLIVYTSARNMIGPFHYKIEEPLSVLPQHFKFENEWSKDNCSFRDRYSFVKFGISMELCEE